MEGFTVVLLHYDFSFVGKNNILTKKFGCPRMFGNPMTRKCINLPESIFLFQRIQQQSSMKKTPNTPTLVRTPAAGGCETKNYMKLLAISNIK